ncbi:MAG TPA: class I SAM-dependent methyltransferase [Armatimonadota bacterium]
MAYQDSIHTAATEVVAPHTYTLPPATGAGSAGSGPSPAHLFAAVNAFQQTAVLKSAVELGVFTAIADGAATPAEIGAKCGASERGIRILCDFLVVIGFLTKAGATYALTEDSAVFLARQSRAYMGGALDFLLSPAIVGGFQDLTAAVRNGGTTMPHEGALAPDHPMWVQFAQSMVPMMMMPAQAIAGIVNGEAPRSLKILDIAAGHGMFGITIAQRNPAAQIVALDWPNVLEIAKGNARDAGVSDRYETISGSAFDVDFGTGYDVVLLTNFIHHFDVPANDALLRKVHAALAPAGRVVALEFVPNEDRVSPPMPATFSMMMLASTPAGDAYTAGQLTGMYADAGFPRCEVIPLPPSPESAVVGYKES